MANSHKEVKENLENLDNLNSLEDIMKPPKPLGFRKYIIPLGVRPLQCSNFDIGREKASTQIQLFQSVKKSIPTTPISKSETGNSTESTVEKTTYQNENIIDSSSYREKIPHLNKALKTIASPIILNKSNINISKYVAAKHNDITFDSSSPQTVVTDEHEIRNNHQSSSNETNPSKPTRPSSWSSVAELVGDTRPSNQSSYSHSDSKSNSNLRNLPTILRNSIPYQSTKNNSINVTSIGKKSLIQRNTDSVTEGYTATLENQREGEQGEQREQNTQTDNNQNFEIIAREVYSLIRQRLQLERERRGNSYSGRLP
ncbi:MAG: hypothetical protein AAFV71_01820 [Cyanobacteria bacterium J06633_8]